MCQHSHNLILAALLQERVKQHDALVLPEAVHVCVGVCAPRGAIYDKQLAQWELQRTCQLLNGMPASEIIKLQACNNSKALHEQCAICMGPVCDILLAEALRNTHGLVHDKLLSHQEFREPCQLYSCVRNYKQSMQPIQSSELAVHNPHGGFL